MCNECELTVWLCNQKESKYSFQPLSNTHKGIVEIININYYQFNKQNVLLLIIITAVADGAFVSIVSNMHFCYCASRQWYKPRIQWQ